MMDVRRSGSKTFFQAKGISGVIGEEFEVIDPDEIGTRTVTSQSVGGRHASNAIQNSMRLKIPNSRANGEDD